MITRHMKIWRQIRSARVSAMPEEERRQELRDAEKQAEHGDGRCDPGVAAVPSGLEPPPSTHVS